MDRLNRLNRLIRAVLPFRGSWRSRSWLGLLLLLLGRRSVQIATLIVIVRRHLFRAKSDANTAGTRVIYFAVGSNDGS